ncbi:MAG: hypothetical protein AB8B69_18690 [Chitinophagales bacterium]
MVNLSTEEQLLQLNPQQLISKYELIIEHIVHTSNLQNRQETIVQIKERLPHRLQKLWTKAKAYSSMQTIFIEAVQLIYEDLQNLQFLRQKSAQLIVQNLPLITARVYYCVRKNQIKEGDTEEVLQMVQHLLLEKLQRGQLSSYTSANDSLFTSFFYVVVNNAIKDVCKSLYQTQKNQTFKELKTETIGGIQNSQNNDLFQSVSSNIQVQQQAKLLGHILQLYPTKEKVKFGVCLKTNYRLVLRQKDGKDLQLSTLQVKTLLEFFGRDYNNATSKEVWEAIYPFISIFEGKQTSAVNLRKWFSRKRNPIIVRLLLFTLNERSSTPEKQARLQKLITTKLNTDREVGRYASIWLGEVVIYWNKN